MMIAAVASGVLLAGSTAGLAFTLNARAPFFRHGRSSILSFFAGWLGSELPLVHVGVQLVCAVALIAAGALLFWPGWIALVLCLLSWWMLLRMYRCGEEARVIVDAALVEALGAEALARVDKERGEELPSLGERLLPFVVGRDAVERIRNLSYGPAGRRNQLDVYRPKVRPTKAPVFVNVHGGAWVVGAKETQARPLVYHLAARGWVCVTINYRLSPRAVFPDHIVDVKRALAWVKAHIAEHGGDPDFIVLSGGSAGGHLASLAALTAGDPAYQPGFEDANLRVQACVPFYGVYDFTNRTGKGRRDMSRFLERWVIQKPFADARDVYDRASPMSRVHADAPPFLIIHGVNDTLVPVEEARLFVELLRGASRAPVAYIELPGAQHAFEVWSSVRTAYVIRGVARFLEVIRARARA